MMKNKILIIVCVLIVAGVVALVFINSGKRVDNTQDESIAGADADGDGLWDYVQKYIDETYPNEPATRAALRQYAVAMQKALVDAADAAASLQHETVLMRARECLRYVLADADGGTAREIRNSLKAEMLNTDERSRAYIVFNRQLGGSFFTLPREDRADSCNFDVDALMGKK